MTQDVAAGSRTSGAACAIALHDSSTDTAPKHAIDVIALANAGRSHQRVRRSRCPTNPAQSSS